MLIAESGSTKTEWRWIQDRENIQRFTAPGVNPNVMGANEIESYFQDTFRNASGLLEVGKVYFYGAGLAEESQKKTIRELLTPIFSNAEINVEHDLLAAVRATRRKEGIVCILGTGSNSAYHKGFQIVKNLGGHGYLFGDEGSGMHIGSRFIKGLLQGDFPSEVQEHLEESSSKSLAEIKLALYKSKKPNVSIAALAKDAVKFIHLDEINLMVKKCFLEFLDSTVCRYKDFQNLELDAVGSIAYHFRDILKQACAERGVNLVSTNQAPIDGLLGFHLDDLNS